MVSRVSKSPRPPESTSEPAWALVLPRTRPALEVCALELRISRDLWRGFWSHPSFCTGLRWAPWGSCWTIQKHLVSWRRGPQRETEPLERQADRHTVGSDAWREETGLEVGRKGLGGGSEGIQPPGRCVSEAQPYLRRHPARGSTHLSSPPQAGCGAHACRSLAARAVGYGNVCGNHQVGSAALPLPASQSSELASLPGIQVGRGRGRRRREPERG